MPRTTRPSTFACGTISTLLHRESRKGPGYRHLPHAVPVAMTVSPKQRSLFKAILKKADIGGMPVADLLYIGAAVETPVIAFARHVDRFFRNGNVQFVAIAQRNQISLHGFSPQNMLDSQISVCIDQPIA